MRQLLDAVVDRLDNLSDGGLWWTTPEQLPSPIRREFPNGAFDLGTAHGAAGVIALLSKAHTAGISAARPVLDRAVKAVLAYRLPNDDTATFPLPGSAGCYAKTFAPGLVLR